MFSKQDIEKIEQRGSSVDQVFKDIEFFKSGFPYLKILSAATSERGILVLNNKTKSDADQKYHQYQGDICKFVPASGAASRMFKDLYEAMPVLERGEGVKHGSEVERFLDNIAKFAFYDDLKSTSNYDISNPVSVLSALLGKQGLDYASKPKGLIKFHKYTDGSRSSFEEHLVEAAMYARSNNGISQMSVTVSAEHLEEFRKHLEDVKPKYMSRFSVMYDVRFTLQSAKTDTIAVDMNNNPFRNEDGDLLFRPGGHGALVENLNNIESDLVIIKNIDNVVREQFLSETIKWKRLLIGVLVGIQEKIFSYLQRLDGEFSEELKNEIILFLERELCISIPPLPEAIVKDFLKTKLNRPIRVCGMVRNLGEPGGGPFIVHDADGSTSLQILESAQLNMENPEIALAVSASTHFNPVDIVCSIKNYKGEKFNLHNFVDRETGFISTKTYEGKKIKALELPGLWNGSMSQWNTVFVEVPLITFNPVKTVNDLLRKEHLA
ncbi:MAG: DUF4301 family protein [Rikenellaceae bacterium]|nr:DUF4301 family protein [Rikenellaceae bacterium]